MKAAPIYRKGRKRSRVLTCGTAILSRFAAYGIGTSAPDILSTGASRYSKLSSTTDALMQKENIVW
uniref:Pyruvate dehydrogenase E1 component subunit beta n=1 Tax=Solanum tuberosum TaxID=4113 RepID=M0ZZ10_SOLTU